MSYRYACMASILVAVLGCGDASGSGQAELGFNMDEAVRVNFRGELAGTIYGQIYRTEDLAFVAGSVVSVPDASRAVADVTVQDADFRTVDRLGATTLTDGLAPGEYSFLGALDVDGNESDLGDPVTFSQQGSFVIETDEVVAFEVVFNGIQPF